MVPCDHCKTLNDFGDWALNLTKVGGKWGCQSFSCPCSQNVTVGERRELFYMPFRLRNLSLHSLPVVWCSWELVFCSLPPPVHHGDSFVAKELLSPLLSPRIIFADRIQSTTARIWLRNIWPLCSGLLWFSFDSLTIDSAHPFKDTRFCRVRQNLYNLFVKVPDGWPRIKDHLQAEGNECSSHFRWGAAVPTASLSISARDKMCVPMKEQKPALGHTSMWLIWNCHRDCWLFGCCCPWNPKVHRNKYPCLFL